MFDIKPPRRVARVPIIGPIGKGRQRHTVVFPIQPQGPAIQTASDLPPEIQRLAQRIGEQQARIVWKWRQVLGNTPSAPELLVYNWLTTHHVQFSYQVPAYGGRVFKGGAVQDFVVPTGGGVMVWEVQGEHWHASMDIQRADRQQFWRLLLGNVQNQRVLAALFLWEDDIYADVDGVCRDALAMHERRR